MQWYLSCHKETLSYFLPIIGHIARIQKSIPLHDERYRGHARNRIENMAGNDHELLFLAMLVLYLSASSRFMKHNLPHASKINSKIFFYVNKFS